METNQIIILFFIFTTGPYEKLFEKIAITNNDPSSKSIQKHYFKLKPVFLGQVSTAKWRSPPSYVCGDQINIGVLERSVKDKVDSPFVSSRALFSNARNCLANIREMIAVVMYWTKEGMPKKRSGENWDIVLERVLDHMWKRNSGKEAPKDTKLIAVNEIGLSYKAQQEKDKEKGSSTSSDRPNGWIPQGWMAFLLFGPTPYKSMLLPLTEVGDAQPKDGESKKQFRRQKHRMNDEFLRFCWRVSRFPAQWTTWGLPMLLYCKMKSGVFPLQYLVLLVLYFYYFWSFHFCLFTTYYDTKTRETGASKFTLAVFIRRTVWFVRLLNPRI